MNRVDFIELATYCIKRYKESFDADDKDNVYVDTLYVAIDKHNHLICSTTPHVLNDACECLLIHRRRALAVTNSYYWYKIEYIDEEGAVTDGVLKKGFSLWTGAGGSFSNQIIQLQCMQFGTQNNMKLILITTILQQLTQVQVNQANLSQLGCLMPQSVLITMIMIN